jgi:hypothetical protein
MSSDYDRREFLKKIGASLAGMVVVPFGLTGCSGGDDSTNQKVASNQGEKKSTGGSTGSKTEKSGGTKEKKKTHKVPHPNDDKVPESEATAKALGGKKRYKGGKSPKDGPSVMYQHKPNGEKHCGTCNLYVPDENGDGFGACTLVEGKIHSCDFCILYSKYTGDASVSCKAV